MLAISVHCSIQVTHKRVLQHDLRREKKRQESRYGLNQWGKSAFDLVVRSLIFVRSGGEVTLVLSQCRFLLWRPRVLASDGLDASVIAFIIELCYLVCDNLKRKQSNVP